MSDAAAQRAQAARLLHGVVARGRTTDEVIGDDPLSPLTQELLLGSLRHYFSLAALVDARLRRTLKPKDLILRSLMIVGAYQLRFLRVPDHAATFETVNACALLSRPWARGLVNAVLRACVSSTDSTECSFEHPEWLEKALRTEYPDAEAILSADNQRAPMALRINQARTTPAAYLDRLDADGIGWRLPGSPADAHALGLGAETCVLIEARRTETLPGHAEGLVSVQDAGAQFAAPLLAAQPGERVLDACAAPGGKLFHLIECSPGVLATALDRDERRMTRLLTEASRLGHEHFTPVVADAADLAWWDGVPFQRVLLDAPCSGTGTVRRHPDIKVLRRAEDLPTFCIEQGRLLDALWRVLEPGGTLLYCTCSILAAENDAVIASFLERQRDAASSPFRLLTGRATRHGWQLLPTQADTDGFYYARMTRVRE